MSDETGSRIVDRPDSFGWVSILLHWTTTVVIIALWFIGNSITEQPSVAAVDARRDLHVTIALSAWLLLLARIWWRYRMGHPQARGQSNLIHRIAQTTHYVLLFFIAVMMLSGPAMVYSGSDAVKEAAHWAHSVSAKALFALVLIHIGGTLKHIIFHEDDTIVRMLWPARPGEQGERRPGEP